MSEPTSFEAIRQSLDGAAISTYVLSMIILPVKYWCRMQNGRRNLGLDDALIFVAAIMLNAFFFDTMIGKPTVLSSERTDLIRDCVGVRPQLGRHANELDLPTIIQFMKFVFPAQLLYVVALAFIKCSLLAFYWRLFSIRSRGPIIAGVVIVIAWCIAVV